MTGKTEKLVFSVTSDKAKIDLMLSAIRKSGDTLAQQMHIAACSTLAHLYLHSDTSVVNNLLDAVHASSRKNAIRDWFTQYGPVIWDENKIRFVRRPEDTDTALLQAKALAEPFWEFSKEAAYKPMDVAAAIQALVKRLETDEKKLKKDHTLLKSTLNSLVNHGVKETPTV